MTTLEDPTLTFYERRLDAARETIVRQQREINHLKTLVNAGHVHRWASRSMFSVPVCLDCGATLI